MAEKINTLSSSERFRKAKVVESDIVDCLNENYGFNLVGSSKQEDIKEKTDAWDSERRRYAIKYRENKPIATDILIAMRDPFYGISHELTVTGRDILYEYYQYICLTETNSTIWVVDGKVVHKVYESMWNEFLNKIGDINVKEKKYDTFFPVKVMDSSEYIGCQIWLCREQGQPHRGRPKLLGFLPPAAFTENEITSYRFF
jgi:hypothetical protein